MIIWLPSFPRSGNTLVRTILYQVYGLKSFSIYEGQDAPQTPREIVETVGAIPYSGEYARFVDEARKSPEPVIIKTHHGPESDDAAIYVVRNGIVATDSYRHYVKVFQTQLAEWGDLVAGCTTRIPTWYQHLDAWNPLERPNTLLIKYEDLVSNHAAQRIAEIGEVCGVVEKKPWENPWKRMHQVGPNFFRRGRASVPPEITAEEAEVFLEVGSNREWMERFSYDTRSPLLERVGYRLKQAFQPRV